MRGEVDAHLELRGLGPPAFGVALIGRGCVATWAAVDLVPDTVVAVQGIGTRLASQHVLPCAHVIQRGVLRRRIIVAVDLGVLEELVRIEPAEVSKAAASIAAMVYVDTGPGKGAMDADFAEAVMARVVIPVAERAKPRKVQITASTPAQSDRQAIEA